jgi:phosphoglycerate kinase
MRYGIQTLDDLDVDGKVVLCRVDINSPLDPATGGLADTTRIRACVPTVKELAERGARLVLLAHQGGDLEYQNYASTEPHAAVLAELLGRPVGFIDDVCGPAARDGIRRLGDGEILLLDNVRFVAEELTLFETKLNLTPAQQAKTLVVRKLTPLADFYVCDAFAAVHRSQPSLVGFEEVLPSAMGRLFEREYASLSHLREDPTRPCVFVLGGTKVDDAFLMMRAVLRDGVVDTVLTGGLVGQIMLLAADVDIGTPSIEFIRAKGLWQWVETSRELLGDHAPRIQLPLDFAFVRDGRRCELDRAELPANEMILDIGHATVESYRRTIEEAGTVFANGPLGVFEQPETEYGTRAIWESMADSKGDSALGGGDSIAAMNKFGLAERIDYVCTAGGGMVRFLSGEELPVVTALRLAAARSEERASELPTTGSPRSNLDG